MLVLPLQQVVQSPGGLGEQSAELHPSCWVSKPGRGLGTCISNHFPSDAQVPGLGTDFGDLTLRTPKRELGLILQTDTCELFHFCVFSVTAYLIKCNTSTFVNMAYISRFNSRMGK